MDSDCPTMPAISKVILKAQATFNRVLGHIMNYNYRQTVSIYNCNKVKLVLRSFFLKPLLIYVFFVKSYGFITFISALPNPRLLW